MHVHTYTVHTNTKQTLFLPSPNQAPNHQEQHRQSRRDRRSTRRGAFGRTFVVARPDTHIPARDGSLEILKAAISVCMYYVCMCGCMHVCMHVCVLSAHACVVFDVLSQSLNSHVQACHICVYACAYC